MKKACITKKTSVKGKTKPMTSEKQKSKRLKASKGKIQKKEALAGTKRNGGNPRKKHAARKTERGSHKTKVVHRGKDIELLSLKQAYGETLGKYGKLLEEQINSNRLKDKALGQFLMGLYLLGLGPDKVLAKCQQMFEPVKTEGEA